MIDSLCDRSIEAEEYRYGIRGNGGCLRFERGLGEDGRGAGKEVGGGWFIALEMVVIEDPLCC